jgi:glutaredoxin-like protein NrdH
MQMTHVAGQNKGQIRLYALSTCVWCGKTKQMLNDLGVEYHFIDVDLLEGDARNEATEELKLLNPRCSFPTVAINGMCIVGFDEEKIQEALRA